jgi:Zn-dependent protease with chaperone function
VPPKQLKGLRPQAYEHSLDKKALDTLEKTPGLGTLVRKCNDWGIERILRVQLTGSNLRITPDSFPRLHDLLGAACSTLDLPGTPELYVAALSEFKVLTAGIDHPIVVLSAATVDSLSDEELLFLLAREVGHIKSGHVLYSQIAEFLPVIAQMIEAATFGIASGLVSVAMEIALLSWRRTSEFTADRAGLLAVQNPDIAFSALMKLAGLPHKYYQSINTADFIAQATKFQALDNDALSWIAKGLSILGSDQPWTVMRAHELLQWMNAGSYEALIAGRFCSFCGKGVPPRDAFCNECGKSLVKTLAGK